MLVCEGRSLGVGTHSTSLNSSELIDDTLEKGPQVVTRRGIDTAVVVSSDEWHKLKDQKHVTWKDVLLGEGPQ